MSRTSRTLFTASLAAIGLIASSCRADAGKTDWKFAFGAAKGGEGVTQVQSGDTYSDEKGYGFEAGANVESVAPGQKGGDGAISSDKPFYFSVKVPEGNYDVTLTLGNPDQPTDMTVKAELRRLMLWDVKTTPEQPVTKTITVNVRQPEYPGGKVHLKGKRESVEEGWAWDDKLTLEFNGEHPSVSQVEVKRVEVPTVFILGDSTVCDQPKEPYTSWGQMLTAFFKPGIAISNQGESGETLRSSLHAHRLDKVLADMKAGDYLFIQFGHNDQKEHGKNDGAFKSYTEDYKKFVEGAKAKGGIPVVVTSMNRRTFDKEGHITNSLGDFPEAARRVAKDENVAMIDLNEMSKKLYEAIGPEKAPELFAIPAEHTHHSAYGAYELAKCIVQGIEEDKLPLAKYVVEDWKGFDPSKPDAFDQFHVPVSPLTTNTKPLGD